MKAAYLGRWGMSFGVDLYQNLVIMLNFLPHSANKTEYDEVDMACFFLANGLGKWQVFMAELIGYAEISRYIDGEIMHIKKKQTINY